MPPELRDPGDPAEWLRRARSNLAKAKAGDVPEVLYEDLCFDAQQASKKAVKALLVKQQVPFPKTHAIGELLRLVQENGIDVPSPIRESALGQITPSSRDTPGRPRMSPAPSTSRR